MSKNNATSGLEVGDTVSVPGGMTGVVKFLGPVQGKNGVFAGVELSKDYASRGKNDGDVDGVRYFTTSIPGSGIFLPSHRATKQASPTLSASTFPPTPTTPSFQNFDLSRKTVSKAKTPPNPSPLPKFSQTVGSGARHPFSQSVGPGARAPSPQQRPKGRPSLPRPESPARNQPKLQSNLGRASLRGIRPPGSPAPAPPSKSSTPVAARSTSRSQSRQGLSDVSPDADNTPTATIRSRISTRSFSNNRASVGGDETQRLQEMLDERDRQLKEQAASLAEMESSLAELQSMMASNNAAQAAAQNAAAPEAGADGGDVSQLRTLVREKNEKIQSLTAEFDSHRADFRSTIDTLEMASTETERVYEKRVQELLQEVYELQSGREDVATVAAQLRQLEDLVQELEEGLEDARRGEAEARSEVEFLRGEIERARLELRREREKASKALAGADAAVGDRERSFSPSNESRDIEQRDDEIRGLKAIIHSLSSGPEMGSLGGEVNGNGTSSAANNATADELVKLQNSIAALQREKSDLKGLIDRKNLREEELERENNRLRSSGGRGGSFGMGYHQKTESSSTATMHTANRNSNVSATTAVRQGSMSSSGFAPPNGSRFSKNSEPTSGSRPVSGKPIADSASSWTESAVEEEVHDELDHHEAGTAKTDDSASVSVDTDTAWCELCETSGHDVLTCSRMFGEPGGETKAVPTDEVKQSDDPDRTITESLTNGNPSKNRASNDYEAANERSFFDAEEERKTDVPVSDPDGAATVPSEPAAASTPAAEQPAEGTAPGKSSGVVDMTKWCAMCEKDGHESVDCPFEDDY